MIRFFLVILVALLPVWTFAQTSPLIMKHADSLAVARKRGILLLHGRVQFVHDSVQFKTQRATWNKDSEVVQCDGGFVFTHPSGYIDAHNGVYQKKQGMSTATGNVHAGDSAHSYYFTGEHLVYDRNNEILTMPEKPRLYQFEKNKEGGEDTVTIVAKFIKYNKKDGFAEAIHDVVITQKEVRFSADSINYDKGKGYAVARGNATIVHDDVTISSDNMNYNKEEEFAEAFDHVKLVQNDMVVTCDTGFFNRKDNWISMKGNPTCDLKNYHLTGDSIYLTLDSTGKTLVSALVIRNAHGIQQEEPKKKGPGNVTEAFGDTLYAEFKNNKIERLYVNLNAKGIFYETDLKDYKNLMDGDRLDMYFNQGKMDKAIVSGKAQSTYFYVKKDRSVSGRNEATGDTIHILFDAQKNAVKSLKLLGNSTMASGRYVDYEKENRKREEAVKDSLAKVMADTSKADSLAKANSLKKPAADTAVVDSVKKIEEPLTTAPVKDDKSKEQAALKNAKEMSLVEKLRKKRLEEQKRREEFKKPESEKSKEESKQEEPKKTEGKSKKSELKVEAQK